MYKKGTSCPCINKFIWLILQKLRGDALYASALLRHCTCTHKKAVQKTNVMQCWQYVLALNKQCMDCNLFWGENGAVVSLRGCWSLARSCWLVCYRRQWRFITSTAQWTFITLWCYSNSVPSEDHPHSLSPSVVATPVLLGALKKKASEQPEQFASAIP